MSVNLNDPNIPIVGSSSKFDVLNPENAAAVFSVVIVHRLVNEPLLYGAIVIEGEPNTKDLNALFLVAAYKLLVAFHPDEEFVNRLKAETNNGENLEALSSLILVVSQDSPGLSVVSKTPKGLAIMVIELDKEADNEGSEATQS